MKSARLHDDGLHRCPWPGEDPLYMAYHDTEWGVPEYDGRALWEKLILDGFQAGLSWITILRKRENFRSAFKGFDPVKVARMTDRDVERLLKDEGIIRHRSKIEAVINNAQRAKELVKQEGSIAAFIWSYEPDARTLAKPQTASTSAESIALSKELKKRGWKFVGPTTVYAFMQAMGLINDHAEGCHSRAKAAKARKTFQKP